MTRLVLLLTSLLVLALPAAASAADTFETVRVPTVGGNTIHVEVARPTGGGKVPIILTYSPYNSLSEYTTPNIANDGIYETYGKKGYARAVADVLGTRNSTGCWDYGGKAEQQSGVDLVNALSKLPWSNGKVAMIGGSYDGTTANMVAARGADAPGLAAIVPQAAISRWYGYAYQDGVRYFGNSEVPSDEGFDTPLAFDFGLTRTPPTHPDAAAQTLPDRLSPCDAPEHTEYGYSRQPDYDGFWNDRDYRKDARKFRVPVLVTHGWQDYNVKQSEGTDLFEALESASNVPFKKLFVFQGAHGTPDHKEYDALVERFFARTLKGVQNGIDREPEVWTEGRDTEDVVKLKTERAWPIPGTGTLGVAMKGGSFTDMANTTEEAALKEPSSEMAWLYRTTAPLRRDARIGGAVVVDLVVRTSTPNGQLAATLVDVAPDGGTTPISRGHLNLQYRGGLSKAQPMPPGAPQRARVRLAPQDQTVRKGHSIGVLLAGSNTVWAVPDEPGVEHTVDRMALQLPVVGPSPSPIPGATLGGAGSQGSSKVAKRAKRLTLRVRRRGSRIIATGRAPRGKRVSLRLTRRGGRHMTRRVIARRGTFRVTFRRVSRRRAVRVTARLTGTKLTATRRLAARRR